MANATGSTGTFDPQQPGNTLGGISSGIGLGALSSGPDATNNFSVDSVNDVVLPVIGTGPITGAGSSASNLGGMVLEPLQMVAGSGYPDGRYRVQSAGGGMPNGTASVEFAVVGGVIVWSRIHRPGSGFTSAPTFTVAQAVDFTTGLTIAGGGTGATFTASIGATGSKPTSMVVPATNKPFRRVTATGAVAIGAAVSPSTYLNLSTRALVSGDEVWAVGP